MLGIDKNTCKWISELGIKSNSEEEGLDDYVNHGQLGIGITI